jgi:outer membrane protein assembly factor BamB
MKAGMTRSLKNQGKEMNMKFIKKTIMLASLLLVVPVLLLAFAGCAGSQVQPSGWPGVAIDTQGIYVPSQGSLVALNPVNGTSVWNVPVENVAGGGGFLSCDAGGAAVAIYGTPVLDGDLIYVAGYNGYIYTYSVSTRLSKSQPLNEDDPKPVVGGLVVADGKVFVGSADGSLYAVEATSLDVLWTFVTGDKIWSTPAYDGQTLYVGSFDRSVYAVDSASGNELWSFATQGPVIATPLVADGKIIVASFDRQIYCLDAATGAELWTFSGGGGATNTPQKWFWANPVLVNGNIYAPNMDGRVYLLNASNGNLVSTFDLQSPVVSSPAVYEGKVIAATEEGKVYVLDAATGAKSEIRDLNQTVRAPLIVENSVLYVHTQTGESVYALNPVTGAVLWYTPLTN